MTDAGRGVIDLDLDDDKVTRKLRGLDKNVGRSGSSAGTSFGSGFTRSVGSSLAGLGRIVATAGAAAAVGLGAVAGAAGLFGLKVAAANETAQVSFELLLGSGEKAGAFLDKLKDFAAKTPFEFPELRDAASRLLAVGTEAGDVIPIMETLGDSTAAMGTGAEGISRAVTALTQIKQKGKVSAEEMLQLTEAGIPAWDALAAVLGTDVTGAMKQVEDRTVTAAQLFQALEDKAGPALGRVTGLMDVQAQSLSGLLSTLKDTVSQNLGEQLQPLADIIKDLLPDITDLAGTLATAFGGFAADLAPPLIGAFSALAEVIAPVVDALGGGFADIFAGLGAAIAGAAPAIADFFEVFSKLGGVIGPLLFIVGALISEALDQLAPVFDAIIEAVKPLIPILGGALIDALKTMRPIWPVFIDAIKELSPLIGELASALGKELVGVFEELLPIMIDNAPAFIDLAEALLDMLIALLPIIGPLAKLAGLFVKLNGLEIAVIAKVIGFLADAIGAVTSFDFAGAWGKVTEAISGFARTVGEQIPKVIQFFKDLPGKVVSALATFATVLVPKGLELLGGFLAGLVRKLPELIGFMLALPFVLLAALAKLELYLLPKAISFLAGFLTGLVRKLPDLIKFMVTLPGKLTGKIIGLATKLIPKGISLLAGFAKGMIQKLPDLLSFVGDLPGKLVKAVGKLGNALFEAGKDLIRGLIRGVKAINPVSAVKAVGGGIVKGFKGALGIGSPSKVMADEVGLPIWQGIEQGFTKASRPLTAPTVGTAAALQQVHGTPVGVGGFSASAGNTVNIDKFNVYDRVDSDRVIFDIGFKLAS